MKGLESQSSHVTRKQYSLRVSHDFDLVMKRGVYNYRGWPGERAHTHIMYLVVVTVVGLIGTLCDTASSQCGLQEPLTA